MKKLINSVMNVAFTKNEPLSLIHFITNRCNARCSFCFIDFNDEKMQSKLNEMKISEYEKLSKTLGPSIQNINLTGGEPFLRSDIFEIVDLYFTNSKVSSILINTNGSLPVRLEKLLKAVKEKHPHKKIFVLFSIDSFAEKHNTIRKIPGLYESVMKCYEIVNKYKEIATASVTLTVSHENHNEVNKLYFHLKKIGIKSISPIIVRDEGVYKIPFEDKVKIRDSYKELTTNMLKDIASNEINGFYDRGFMGNFFRKVQNSKNKIQYELIADAYMKPKYVMPCVSGSIFGVIQADGTVYPCEILDKPIGKLKEYDFNFSNLWKNNIAKSTRKWIKETKCNCHWECAMTYNIISNKKYQYKIAKDIILK